MSYLGVWCGYIDLRYRDGVITFPNAMNPTVVAFLILQVVFVLTNIFYVLFANRPSKSFFIPLLGIILAVLYLAVPLALGFGFSTDYTDITGIFFLVLMTMISVILSVSFAYTLGDILYYSGGAVKLKPPSISGIQNSISFWLIIPIWIIILSTELLILLNESLNALAFGTGMFIIFIIFVHYGYLRITGAQISDMRVGAHLLAAIRARQADIPNNINPDDPVIQKNTAIWILITGLFQLAVTAIGLIFSLALPEMLVAGIALASATHLVVYGIPLMLAHVYGYREENRHFSKIRCGDGSEHHEQENMMQSLLETDDNSTEDI
jgi:hypothetical protein